VTKDSKRKKNIRALMDVLALPYMQTANIYDGRACAFCQALLKQDADDNYLEDVGEIISRRASANPLPDSVLIHPDCAPRGWDAIQQGHDPEWIPA
jgi:hypothetical protein